MKRTFWSALLLVGSAMAGAQTLTVTAAHFSDSAGNVVTGKLTVQPTLANGTPTAYLLGGGGWRSGAPVGVYAQAGVLSITLPDTALTSPQNICFRLASVSPSIVLGPGYSCLQPASTGQSTWCTTVSGATTCNLDAYAPALSPLPTLSYVQSINGAAGSWLFTGSGVICNVTTLTCTFSGGGGGTWPGYPGAGIVNSTGSAWGTSYSSSNQIPASFVNLSAYLTSAIAASTYQPLLGFTPYNATNPAGYIASSALSPYLLSATAASTYAPIFTLTTTGSSGPATYSGNVLNIPQYSGGSGMVYPAAGIPNSTGSAWGTSFTAPAGAIVGTTDTQTLTNKTLDGVTPTVMGYVDPTSSIQAQLNAKLAASGFTSAAIQSLLGASVYDAYGAAATAQSNAEAASDPSGAASTAQSNAEAYAANASNISSGTLGHARLPALLSADIPNNAANTSGTATNLSGTPALPNGTTATTQSATDASADLATDAFVAAVARPVANTTLVVSSGTQGAKSCSSAATITMSGLTTTMTALVGYSANPSALTGWGSTGGMVLQAWPSAANTLSWVVCNQTSSSITYSAITLNMGAR